MALHCSAGKLSTRPPSVYSAPSIFTGSKRIGIAIDARMDFANIPLFSTSASPSIRLVAIHKNGIGISLKSTGSEYPTESELKRFMILSPETIPVGREFLNDLD